MHRTADLLALLLTTACAHDPSGRTCGMDPATMKMACTNPAQVEADNAAREAYWQEEQARADAHHLEQCVQQTLYYTSGNRPTSLEEASRCAKWTDEMRTDERIAALEPVFEQNLANERARNRGLVEQSEAYRQGRQEATRRDRETLRALGRAIDAHR